MKASIKEDKAPGRIYRRGFVKLLNRLDSSDTGRRLSLRFDEEFCTMTVSDDRNSHSNGTERLVVQIVPNIAGRRARSANHCATQGFCMLVT
ncbi:hypothetical protein RRG08_012358 [Elysia crispata]|uniref:Uncharacterized protein n=1 Tax=Elysia crispata TaxID=231223 RepID=A0AAE1ABM9_9GAST|nr:hypothetical protein RRG08_012358 [Elysia crispata]